MGSKDILGGELLGERDVGGVVEGDDAHGVEVDGDDLEVHVVLQKVEHQLHVRGERQRRQRQQHDYLDRVDHPPQPAHHETARNKLLTFLTKVCCLEDFLWRN